ncbi:DegT/DnrJ/EryC1/StrS family aminotransferase [Candidatus Parcubacteria bacterium]|nr:MAG: DegT/DnrJ/EryC1/StrS family aminotransferase [Candidatus Parcubacteria bacterium]
MVEKLLDFVSPEEYIPFSPPDLDESEERELVATLRSGWITTGPRTQEFERRVAEYAGARYAVGVFSCTDAMHLALRILGARTGDEVITTPFTFVSTAHAVRYCGAVPVLADIDPETLCIDPAEIEKRITPKTKGIIPVHYGGHACDMDPILALAEAENLFVMEDAAHAIGTRYKDRPVGSLGHVTCFSFYATKNLCTAEGGMALTDDEEMANRMRRLAMYGISDAREVWQARYTKAGSIHYDVAELGYKCNMTDITAALGLVQLEKLENAIANREEFSRIYDQAFAEHPGVTIPTVRPWIRHSRHLYHIQLNLGFLNINRDRFVDELKALNIGTSVMFVPVHFFTYYAKLLGYKLGDFPVAESTFKRILSLPISPAIGRKRIEKAAEGVLYLLEKHKR